MLQVITDISMCSLKFGHQKQHSVSAHIPTLKKEDINCNYQKLELSLLCDRL